MLLPTAELGADHISREQGTRGAVCIKEELTTHVVEIRLRATAGQVRLDCAVRGTRVSGRNGGAGNPALKRR